MTPRCQYESYTLGNRLGPHQLGLTRKDVGKTLLVSRKREVCDRGDPSGQCGFRAARVIVLSADVDVGIDAPGQHEEPRRVDLVSASGAGQIRPISTMAPSRTRRSASLRPSTVTMTPPRMIISCGSWKAANTKDKRITGRYDILGF